MKKKTQLLFQRVTGYFLFVVLVITGVGRVWGYAARQQLSVFQCMNGLVSETAVGLGFHRFQDVYITDQRMFSVPEEVETRTWQANAQNLNLITEVTGLPITVVVMPNAGELYGDTLPDGCYVSQQEGIRQFYEMLDDGVRSVDVVSVLSPYTDESIYYRTENCWTGYGAFCVYQNLIRKMGMLPIDYDNYTVVRKGTFRGNLYQKCGDLDIDADLAEQYICQEGATITDIISVSQDGSKKSRELYSGEISNPETYLTGTIEERLLVETDCESKRKLLLITDGSGNLMLPFLAQHFCKICVVKDTDAALEVLNEETYDYVASVTGIPTNG